MRRICSGPPTSGRHSKWRRPLVAQLLVFAAAAVFAVAAGADSGDVKVSSPAPGQHPFQTGVGTVDTATGHVTVQVAGGWSWPTHGSDCNTNRAGTGVAVNWFDPKDRGFHVAYFPVNGETTTNTTAGGPDDFGVGSTNADGLNSVDNVVHPTENDYTQDPASMATVTKVASSGTTRTLTATNTFKVGNSITVSGVSGTGVVGSNYNGTYTISAVSGTTVSYTAASSLTQAATTASGTVSDTTTGAVVDITSPSQWASWRGGCGVYTNDTILVRNSNGTFSYTSGLVAHGNFGRWGTTALNNQWGVNKDVSGTAVTNPTPPAATSQAGALLQHVYASKSDLSRLCALTYDVHTGTAASANNGVGIPGKQSEVTAGDQAVAAGTTYTSIHNTDNSIQSNGGTPTGNTCPSFFFPSISTVATGGTFGANGSVTLSDSVTVSGADPNSTGSILVKMWDSTCSNVIDHTTITLGSGPNNKVNDTYSWSSTAATQAGDYKFSADLLNASGTTLASSACGADKETATASKLRTGLTTDATNNGNPDYAPTNSLTDTATLSGGTSNAGGTITFTLYADDGQGSCGTQVGSPQVVTVNNGANGQQYQAKLTDNAIAPGATGNATYHWTATYTGDGQNSPSSSGCGANNENPVVLWPHISITKNPKNQTVENNGTITFTIVVTNDGNVDLSNVAVTDPKASNCANTIPNLPHAAGSNTATYTCTSPALTSSDTNRADVSGTAGNATVTAFDTAPYTVLHPNIEVTKNPPIQSVPRGGTANFTILVKNVGDTRLSNINVTDAQAPNCAEDGTATTTQIENAFPGRASGYLDQGESFTYPCSLPSVQAVFVNVVQASGTDSLGTIVQDNDTDAGGTPGSNCPATEADQCAAVGISGVTSAQDFKPKDTATLSGLVGTPDGVLTFALYKDPAGQKACAPSDLIYETTVTQPTLNGNGDYAVESSEWLSTLVSDAIVGGAGIGPGTAGNYNWQITYTGDTQGNADITGTCGTENFQVANGG